MGEDLIPILTRFHREVIAPEMRRVVIEAVDALEGRMNAHFDAIYKRFDRLETRSKSVPSRLDSNSRASPASPPATTS